MSIIDDLKNQVKRAGSNKGKFVFFKPGVKVRIRFLNELDEGIKILVHDSFELGIQVPCQELFGKDCEYCDRKELRHRENYMWSVWDYEAKEVRILMGVVSNYSPIPALVGMYDMYGTIIDRDYVITKTGSGTDQTWAVVPMDKVTFKNKNAKVLTEKAMLKIVDKAYPNENAEEEDEDEDDVPKKKVKAKKVRDEEYDDDDEEEEEVRPKKKQKKQKKQKKESEYEDMTAKELFLECKDRGIKCKPKKDEDYYIELLENYDEEEDEEDEW